jgi:hypothetical protein
MSELTDTELLELHELLDALVENNLPKDKLRKLELWIADNEEVRKQYVEFMDMSASLRHYAEELISDDTDDSIDPDPQNGQLLSFFKPLISIAALLLVGFFLIVEIRNNPADPNAPQVVRSKTGDSSSSVALQEVIVDTVAVLTKSVGIVWDDSAKFRPDLGETLEPCSLKIAKGLVQVEFLQGATVVLEGPVERPHSKPR